MSRQAISWCGPSGTEGIASDRLEAAVSRNRSAGELLAGNDRVEVHADRAGLEPGATCRELIPWCARLRSDRERRRGAGRANRQD